MADVQNVITLGIGSAPGDIRHFVLVGLDVNPVTLVPLTLKARGVGLTLQSKGTGLTLGAKGTGLTLQSKGTGLTLRSRSTGLTVRDDDR